MVSIMFFSSSLQEKMKKLILVAVILQLSILIIQVVGAVSHFMY